MSRKATGMEPAHPLNRGLCALFSRHALQSPRRWPDFSGVYSSAWSATNYSTLRIRRYGNFAGLGNFSNQGYLFTHTLGSCRQDRFSNVSRATAVILMTLDSQPSMYCGVLNDRNGSSANLFLLPNVVASPHRWSYEWNHTSSEWDRDTGLVAQLKIPFVLAVAIEPAQASLWLIQDWKIQRHVHVESKGTYNLSGRWTIGNDTYNINTRAFPGIIHDVRIWTHRTLVEHEILDTYECLLSNHDPTLQWMTPRTYFLPLGDAPTTIIPQPVHLAV